VGSKKYSDQRSHSCQESAIASPCNKPWSCHNVSACSKLSTFLFIGPYLPLARCIDTINIVPYITKAELHSW
jgi:hypothetical protein